MLADKWRAGTASASVLLAACEAAKQRWITSKHQEEQQRLRDQLVLQQLFLATLQRATTDSPLFRPHNAIDVFGAIHDPIHLLATNRVEQLERLVLRGDLALRVTPSVVEGFTTPYVGRATALSPYTSSSVSADHAFTYASSALVAKIENASVALVFRAVLTFFGSLEKEIQRHCDVVHNINVSPRHV